ncbi:hypothetical protein B0H12DRAFT_1144551 [Mycena haematopus]|nr:hypothetical protein B0H12DRAFT_1144551 [Mycena haematopus]
MSPRLKVLLLLQNSGAHLCALKEKIIKRGNPLYHIFPSPSGFLKQSSNRCSPLLSTPSSVSLRTTHVHWTNLRLRSPARSIFHRSAQVPRTFASPTLMRLIFCSAHSASMSL